MYEIYFLIFLFGVLGFLFSRVLSKLNTSRDTGKFKNIRLSYSKYIMIISLVIIISSIISTLIEFFTFKLSCTEWYIVFGTMNLFLSISCLLILFLLFIGFTITNLIAYINKRIAK